MDKCNVCGQSEFTLLNGFYYCDECGTAAKKIELDTTELEVLKGKREQKISTLKAKEAAKQEKHAKRLTSYEQFNYIVYGLTNQLIELGVVGKQFKLTMFQIWTHYLRRIEVAFFNKSIAEMPKMPACYKKTDIELLFNRKRKRKPSNSSNRSSNSFVSERRKARKLQRELARSEYDSKLSNSEQDRELERSLTASVTSESAASGSIKMSYSRSARRTMKKMCIRKSHINKHENDLNSVLDCHRVTKNLINPIEILSKSNIFALLYIALKESNSELEIGDLIRYGRENHIETSDGYSFVPEHIERSHLVETLSFYNRSVLDCHLTLRRRVEQLTDFLDIELKKPNLYSLCVRYIEELCLPKDILVYIERLLAFSEPVMSKSWNSSLPAFEGRAMAYILFIMKMIFGLNDETELKLSESACELNQKFIECDIKISPIFNWIEWTKYIEMRNIIIVQCDPLTYMQMDTYYDRNLLLEYWENHKQHTTNDKTLIENKIHIPNSINQLHANFQQILNEIEKIYGYETHEKALRKFEFPPSLTPFRKYLEIIIDSVNSTNEYKNIFIHESMKILDFTCTQLDPFINSEKFKNKLKHLKIELNMNKVKNNFEQFHLVEPSVYENTRGGKKDLEEFYIVDTDNCDEEQWEIENKVEHNETANNKKPISPIDYEMMLQQRFQKCLNLEKESLETLDNNYQQQKYLSKNSSQNSTNISFNLPNFHYWTRDIDLFSVKRTKLDEFEQIQNEFPKSFNFLLKECSRIVEMESRDVYGELLILENYFINCIEPIFANTTKPNHYKFKSRSLRRNNQLSNITRLFNLF
uniref:Putative tata box-binding protein-associated factor rna polymerase i subunit b n=1 Tax=Corethrella appendiculata TaxID=1370023 RepID=U5ER76_9DIPT